MKVKIRKRHNTTTAQQWIWVFRRQVGSHSSVVIRLKTYTSVITIDDIIVQSTEWLLCEDGHKDGNGGTRQGRDGREENDDRPLDEVMWQDTTPTSVTHSHTHDGG